MRFSLLGRRGLGPLAAALYVAFVLGTVVRTVVHAETTDEEKKRAAFLKAREEMKAVPSSSDDDSPTPTPKPKPAKHKKKSAAKKEATPEPTKTPAAKKKPTPNADDDDETPTPSPKKSGKKKSEKGEKPKASATPHKKKAEAERAPEPKSSSPSPKPAEPAVTASAPPPRAIPAATEATPAAPPAEITVQKSGFEKEQGFEPPPPPPPKRGLFARLFGRAEPTVNYRYLNRSLIEELRRAAVQRGRWKFIVVHNSGTRQGNARAFDYYHKHVRKMANGLAYHFVIGNGTSSGNGQVEIGDRWRRQINGGHVHSDYLNNISLGICLVGDFNKDQPTRGQLDACEELIRYLRTRCGKADGRDIPVRPHREVNPPQWATDCPGDAFPYGFFRKF